MRSLLDSFKIVMINEGHGGKEIHELRVV